MQRVFIRSFVDNRRFGRSLFIVIKVVDGRPVGGEGKMFHRSSRPTARHSSPKQTQGMGDACFEEEGDFLVGLEATPVLGSSPHKPADVCVGGEVGLRDVVPSVSLVRNTVVSTDITFFAAIADPSISCEPGP